MTLPELSERRVSHDFCTVDKSKSPLPERKRGLPPVFFLFLAVCIETGCSSAPPAPPLEVPVPNTPVEEPWEITAVQDSGSGTPLPEWVDRYLWGGNRLVEEMPEFTGFRVFVSEEEGTSFSALERWSHDFDPARDFPSLAAIRVNQRLRILGGNNPEPEFSRFQEEAVRAVADTDWPGVKREADFWLRKHFSGERENTEERESFLFLILVTVSRESFRNLLDGILWRQQPENAGEDRSSRAAITRRMSGIFYEDF